MMRALKKPVSAMLVSAMLSYAATAQPAPAQAARKQPKKAEEFYTCTPEDQKMRFEGLADIGSLIGRLDNVDELVRKAKEGQEKFLAESVEVTNQMIETELRKYGSWVNEFMESDFTDNVRTKETAIAVTDPAALMRELFNSADPYATGALYMPQLNVLALPERVHRKSDPRKTIHHEIAHAIFDTLQDLMAPDPLNTEVGKGVVFRKGYEGPPPEEVLAATEKVMKLPQNAAYAKNIEDGISRATIAAKRTYATELQKAIEEEVKFLCQFQGLPVSTSLSVADTVFGLMEKYKNALFGQEQAGKFYEIAGRYYQAYRDQFGDPPNTDQLTRQIFTPVPVRFNIPLKSLREQFTAVTGTTQEAAKLDALIRTQEQAYEQLWKDAEQNSEVRKHLNSVLSEVVPLLNAVEGGKRKEAAQYISSLVNPENLERSGDISKLKDMHDSRTSGPKESYHRALRGAEEKRRALLRPEEFFGYVIGKIGGIDTSSVVSYQNPHVPASYLSLLERMIYKVERVVGDIVQRYRLALRLRKAGYSAEKAREMAGRPTVTVGGKTYTFGNNGFTIKGRPTLEEKKAEKK